MGHTDERASKYGISKSYFSTPSAIMHIKPDLNINSYKDLAGMNVAVGSGSYHEKDLNEIGTIKSLDALNSTYLMFQGMVQGKYDAIVQDQTMLQYTATNTQILRLCYRRIIPIWPIIEMMLLRLCTKTTPSCLKKSIKALMKSKPMANLMRFLKNGLAHPHKIM